MRAPFTQRKPEVTGLPVDAPVADKPSGIGGGAGVPSAPETVHALGVAITIGGVRVALLILMLARSKAIALLLGPQGVGIVSTMDQLVQFLMAVFALSLSMAPIRFLSRTLDRGIDAVSRIYQALFKSLLISTVTGTALCLLAVALNGQFLGATLASYKSVAMVALGAIPLLALNLFFGSVLAATKGYRSVLCYMFASSFGSLVASYVGIRLGGILGLYYGNLIVGLAVVLGALWYVHTALRLSPHSSGFRLWQELRRHQDMFSYCTIFYVLAFVQPLSVLFSRYSVLHSLGPLGTGHFQAAMGISGVVSMVIVQTIRTHLEPQANRDIPNEDKIRAANDLQRSITPLILLGGLPVVLFPREVLILLFSSAFTPISPYLFLFVLSECIFLCGQIYLSVVQGINDLRRFFAVQMVGHVCLAIFSWVLVPKFGLAGVAWAFLLSRTLVLVAVVAILQKGHGLHVPASLKGLFLYGLAAIVAAGLFSNMDPALSLPRVLARLSVFVSLTLGVFLFLTQEERAWIGKMLNSWKGPKT